MLPVAHLIPQPKGYLDRFSHFCTVHGRMLSGMPKHFRGKNMPKHVLPLKLPLHMGIWTPFNTWFLGSTRLSIPNGILIG